MGSITIDRAVLEQALELLDDAAGYGDGLSEIDAAYAIIHEALAPPEPFDLNEALSKELFRTAFEPKPEPVAWMWRFEYDEGAAFSTKEPTISIRDGVNYVPLYTAPPPPQRQPLTEEQITEILGGYPAAVRQQLVLLVRAVEALHEIGGDK